VTLPELTSRLKDGGLRHFDELIHEQAKEWLLANFAEGASDFPVNIARLMRNIVWQLRERVMSGARDPLHELVRTFWYMFIKPTLARAGVLSTESDQYAQLVDNMVAMVKELDAMRYKDIGFRDDNAANRKVGANVHIILFAEKLGHRAFLDEVAAKYDVTTVALGGQPSVINVEYMVDTLRATGVDLRRSFYLFSIVDYDTSGWIIQQAFLDDLKFYGIPNVRLVELVNPDQLTADEVKLSRYPLPAGLDMKLKNETWLRQVRERNYKNQPLLEEKTGDVVTLYGLESESISSQRLMAELEQVMVPLLGKNEDLLKIYELRKLDQAVKDLIIHKITNGEDTPTAAARRGLRHKGARHD
jgi:hypothetical protein